MPKVGLSIVSISYIDLKRAVEREAAASEARHRMAEDAKSYGSVNDDHQLASVQTGRDECFDNGKGVGFSAPDNGGADMFSRVQDLQHQRTEFFHSGV